MLSTFTICMIATGVFAGLLSGIFGLGGGIIVVPILALFYDFQLAVCISLGVMIFSSGVTIISKFLHAKILWHWIKVLLPGMLIGVLIGDIAHHFIPAIFLKLLLSVIMPIIGIILFKSANRKNQPMVDEEIKPLYPNVVGSILGLLSGLLGIGMGSFCLPYLIYHRVSVQQASAIASICTFMVSVIGFMMIHHQVSDLSSANTINFWHTLIILGIVSCTISPIASRLTKHTNTRVLQFSLAVLLVVLGLSMLTETLATLLR